MSSIPWLRLAHLLRTRIPAPAGLDLPAQVVLAAETPAKLTGFPGPRMWVCQDYPTRINLILESLGREERL